MKTDVAERQVNLYRRIRVDLSIRQRGRREVRRPGQLLWEAG
jgi:hypothetical protein